MSKLNIKLTFGGEFVENPPAVTSVSVRAKTAVNYNATTAAVPTETTDVVTTITPYDSGATYSVIFSPQTIDVGATFVSIVIGSNTYSYRVAENGHKFASSTNYTLTLRVGKDNDKIELVNDITVGEWGSGGLTIGGDAVEKPVPSPSAYVIVGVTATDSIYVYDRNAGIYVPTPEDVPIAPNYTNNAPDVNPLFKGDYYTWVEAEIGKNSNGSPMCADGWRWPTKDELEAIQPKIKRKNGGENHAISYIEDDVTDNICCFPFSGDTQLPSYLDGHYWSSTGITSGGASILHIDLNSSRMISWFKSKGQSVRCVKTVP